MYFPGGALSGMLLSYHASGTWRVSNNPTLSLLQWKVVLLKSHKKTSRSIYLLLFVALWVKGGEGGRGGENTTAIYRSFN